MRQNVAPTSLSIKIVTSLILVLTGGMFIGAFFNFVLLWAGIFMFTIALFCYLSAPIAYELNGDQLIINSRLSKKVFGPISKCSLIDENKPSFTIRLWGNGGIFAGTGFFWNKKYGVFRAYVSTGERSKLMLIETPESKVVITPENPKKFLAYANSLRDINR